MADYATAVGFVQFPVNERDANGKEVRDVTIRTPGTPEAGGGALIRITVWPDLADVDVNEGDFVAVDGKVEVRVVDGKTYINMSASKLAVLSGAVSLDTGEREVVGKKSDTKKF